MDELTARRRERRRQKRMRLVVCYGAVLLVSCIVIGCLVYRHHREQIRMSMEPVQLEFSQNMGLPRDVTEMERPPLDVELLTVNEYSRPGFELEKVNGIVIHYTANPGTSAMDNRNYFENLKTTHATKVSSHFIIGLEGEIIQCIPCNEWAYASNERNEDTISIECCIGDETGAFNEQTYRSLIELVSWLCFRYGLSSDDLLRHYDITGKNCPKSFVEDSEKWDAFREDVSIYMEKKRNK